LRRAEGVPLAGIIGHELFKRFVVTIDYGHRRLSLTLPSAFSYTGRGTPVPVTFNGAMPQVEGEVDSVRGRFDLDTGSRAGLTLLRPFGEAHGLAERYRPGYEAVTGWGIGGPSRARVIRVGELRLGDVSIAGVIGELSTQAKGAFTDPHAAGMVGGGVLKRFNVTFDYSGRRVIFERNANDRTPDAADRAGLWLNLGDDSFEVADVVEASPAADAGIARGDRILALDGGKPPGLTLADARQALRAAPGTRVRLTVESPGGVREAVIVLRELV
jgi:PDZ domain